MLCGELISTSATRPLSLHLGLAETRSPYFTLLTICQGMAALTANAGADDEDIFLENGLLSYENPNYHLAPSRLDDELNSNTESLYEDIYHELDAVCNMSRGSTTATGATGGGGAAGRRAYAALDIATMGVDVTAGPQTNLDAAVDNHQHRSTESSVSPTSLDNSVINDNAHFTACVMGRRPAGGRGKPDLIETVENRENARDKLSENRNSGEVQHTAGQLNNDLYAVPVKRRLPGTPPSGDEESPKDAATPDNDLPDDESLPPGWEKHEDNDGPYFWHIKSGTIQREPPAMPANGQLESRRPTKEADIPVVGCTVARSTTSSALSDERRSEDAALKRRSYPAAARADPAAIRFAVRSLGWVEIAEDDLTPERSSKAVNKCIVDLSLGRNDLLDVVGRWGDGKDLFMDLDEGALKLIDPENLTLLNTQPIHTIRVWGVGRDNGRERDFAYVARDRTTRKHMCHVFRCDIPARTIANTLRDICKRIMIERSLQQGLTKPQSAGVEVGAGGGPGGGTVGARGLAARPTNLPTEHRRLHRGGAAVTQSFPTPMEEPKKVLRAQYLGSTQVSRATGVETLNDAIEHVTSTLPHDKWLPVHVAVAPSMISILHPGDENKLVAECRVRYLSFLGIGQNVKQCGFIVHTAQDLFVAHIFHCEPSSGALCKTVEAACKLRYQKCLDAHPQGVGRSGAGAHTPGRGLGATLKSLVGSLTGRKLRASES